MKKFKETILVQEARDKGFESRDNLVNVYEDYWYLWMCELKEWFLEKHFINIRIASNSRTSHFPMNEILDLDGTTGCGAPHLKNHKTRIEALEEGLRQALKLIK